MENKKTLYRDTDNKMLGGVASGLAGYMDWDVTVVRLAFVFCLFAVQGSV
jgi:phage shock protein PspC (stress-responsive transcriptional regulator)